MNREMEARLLGFILMVLLFLFAGIFFATCKGTSARDKNRKSVINSMDINRVY